MADKIHNTRPIHAQGGPVTSAISAVREPTAPFFVPVQEGDSPVSGWHLGRRHDWDDAGRLEVVWLDVWQEPDGIRFALWRAGGASPENPNAWTLQLRIAGIRSTPAGQLDLTATRH